MGFLVGTIRTQCKEEFFFFWVWVFLWGLGMANFVTHFLILIVKVHKMSRIYIQVSSCDYYTFRFLKVLYLHSCNIKKKWSFYWFLWRAQVVWNNDEFLKNSLNFCVVLLCIPNSLAMIGTEVMLQRKERGGKEKKSFILQFFFFLIFGWATIWAQT